MDRRAFIKKGCTACLSATALASMTGGCLSTQYRVGRLGKDGITLSKDDFVVRQNKSKAYSSFVIVRNDALNYPICVYRLSDSDYTALWMRCTHHGAELQASGDVLQCTAHGSEFTNKGDVRNGPADSGLRTFPVTVTGNNLFIDLRKRA